MAKTNRRKRDLDCEHHASAAAPNPLLYTPDPWQSYMSPVLTLPGKPAHRICRGRP